MPPTCRNIRLGYGLFTRLLVKSNDSSSSQRLLCRGYEAEKLSMSGARARSAALARAPAPVSCASTLQAHRSLLKRQVESRSDACKLLLWSEVPMLPAIRDGRAAARHLRGICCCCGLRSEDAPIQLRHIASLFLETQRLKWSLCVTRQRKDAPPSYIDEEVRAYGKARRHSEAR